MHVAAQSPYLTIFSRFYYSSLSTLIRQQSLVRAGDERMWCGDPSGRPGVRQPREALGWDSGRPGVRQPLEHTRIYISLTRQGDPSGRPIGINRSRGARQEAERP